MDNAIAKKIISYVILSSVFIGGEWMNIGFRVEWYHFAYGVFAFVSFLLYKRFSIKVAAVFIVFAIAAIAVRQYDLSPVLKQLLNIGFSIFVFYNFLMWENWNFEQIFSKYLVLCKIILVIGFFQVFIFAIGAVHLQFAFLGVARFLLDSNISGRFQSLSEEPSFIGFAFAPIVFFSLYNLWFKRVVLVGRTWSILFIIAYLLTLSVVAYIGLIIILAILYFRKVSVQKLYFSGVFIVFLSLLVYGSYRTVSGVKMRVDDTLYGYTHDITKVYDTLNLTSYSFLSNLYVTKTALNHNPVIGTGLGTYSRVYDLYMPVDMREYSEINREDAGSMALRLIVETGVAGLGIFIFFLIWFKIKSRPGFTDDQEFLWIINSGIFVMIVLFLIRNGNYTYHARILFMMIYYYSARMIRK